MKEIRHFQFSPLDGRLTSLCWANGQLVDFGGGIIRYDLDGTCKRKWGAFSYTFDRAVFCRSGNYAITYQSLGTKGLVLKGDEIVREINRSYYCAETYEYPVALFERFDGKIVIAHCPEKYNRLEIEEVETGRRLSARQTEAVDFFHSQLRTGPEGRRLLSSGWVWHPWDVVVTFDLVAADVQPGLFDKNTTGIGGIEAEEISSAEFLNSTQVVYAGQDAKGESILGVYDVIMDKVISEVRLEQAAGVLMPLGDYVVSFFDHPKLIEIATGKVIHRWDEVSSGRQQGSIIGHLKEPPKIALDPQGKRFAVGNNERVSVVELGE